MAPFKPLTQNCVVRGASDELEPRLRETVGRQALGRLGVVQGKAWPLAPHRTHTCPSAPNRPWRPHLPDGPQGADGTGPVSLEDPLRCRKPGSLCSARALVALAKPLT
jgi:hypothetical protein